MILGKHLSVPVLRIFLFHQPQKLLERYNVVSPYSVFMIRISAASAKKKFADSNPIWVKDVYCWRFSCYLSSYYWTRISAIFISLQSQFAILCVCNFLGEKWPYLTCHKNKLVRCNMNWSCAFYGACHHFSLFSEHKLIIIRVYNELTLRPRLPNFFFRFQVF